VSIDFNSSKKFRDSLNRPRSVYLPIRGSEISRSMVWYLVKIRHDQRISLSIRLTDQWRDRVCRLRDTRETMWNRDVEYIDFCRCDFRRILFLSSRLLTVSTL